MLKHIRDLGPPLPLSHIQVVEKVRSFYIAAEELRKKRIALLIHSPDEWVFTEDVLLYGADKCTEGASEYLKKSGCFEVKKTTNFEESLASMRGMNFEAFFIWYDGTVDSETCKEQVIGFFEARDTGPIPLIILCKNAKSLRRAKELFEGFFIALFLHIDEKPSTARKSFELLYKEVRNKKTAIGAYLYLRRPWALGASKKDHVSIPDHDLEVMSKVMNHVPFTHPWSEAEKILHLILEKRFNAASRRVEHLVGNRENYFDGIFLKAVVLANTKSKIFAGRWLLDQSQKSFSLNQERYWRIGKNLAKWCTLDSLGVLLSNWYKDPKINKGHQFNYLVSRYFNLVQDYEKETNFLHCALMEAPYRGDYMAQTASLLEKNKNYSDALLVWKFAYLSHSSHKIYVITRIIKILFDMQKFGEAREFVHLGLKEEPENMTLNNYHDKISSL